MENPEGTLTGIESAAIKAHKRLTDAQSGLSFIDIFKAGYEQAVKDTITYIKENPYKYILDLCDDMENELIGGL